MYFLQKLLHPNIDTKGSESYGLLLESDLFNALLAMYIVQ